MDFLVAVDADEEGVIGDLEGVVDFEAFAVDEVGFLFLDEIGDEFIDFGGREFFVKAFVEGFSAAEDFVDAVVLGGGGEDDGGLGDEEEFFSDGGGEGFAKGGFVFVAF